jgi:hypothetical protein
MRPLDIQIFVVTCLMASLFTSPTPACEADPQAQEFPWHLGWLLLVPMIYVLSVGPAERFYANRTPPKAVVTFYSPLKSVSRGCKPVSVFLDWYVYQVWVRP